MARTTRIKSGVVRVEGLTELSRDLKAMGPEFQKELTRTNKEVAGFVADSAAGAAYAIGGVAAHVAPSIKAAAGVGWAGVSIGGPGFPMAGGAEFGSYRSGQFQPWRGNGADAGYFLYPTIRKDAEQIEGQYVEAVDRLLRKNRLA